MMIIIGLRLDFFNKRYCYSYILSYCKLQQFAMPFKKGQSGNPARRKKGSLNKVNKDRKAFISYIFDLNT